MVDYYICSPKNHLQVIILLILNKSLYFIDFVQFNVRNFINPDDLDFFMSIMMILYKNYLLWI